MSRAWRAIVILLCAIAGGALNLYRHVWWHSGGTPSTFGFCAPAELQARDLNRFAPGYCRIEIPGQRWRPLDVTVWMKAPAPLPATLDVLGAAGRTVRVTIDDPAGATAPNGTSAGAGADADPDADAKTRTVTVSDAWRPYTFAVTTPPKAQAPLTLVLRVDQPPIANPLLAYVVAGPMIGRVDVAPRVTIATTAWPVLAGALFGIVAALLIPGVVAGLPRHRPGRTKPARNGAGDRDLAGEREGDRERERKPERGQRREAGAHTWRSAAIVFVTLMLYFAVWALVRPPYQTPDEGQHHLRASSVPRNPWFAMPGAWEFDPRFANPLASWAPPALDKLFFNVSQHLSRDEVRVLKGVAWPTPDNRPAPEVYERAIASYPTLYYLTLFALAEPLTQVLHLTPYDSTYVYRLVSAALAACVWTLVFVLLTRLAATRDSAVAMMAVLVLNPMTAFMSSAINVDAVNIPLAVLASLLFWRLLATGEGRWWTPAALVATAWTKPSGLQLMGALLVASVLLGMLRTVPLARLKIAGLTLARAAIVSWCGFYAWSPPRFLGEPPSQDTLTTYLTRRWTMAPDTWVTYWGRLGWLEYSLAPIWYVLVLVAVLIGIACVLWRPRGSRAFVLFAGTLLVAFVGATLAGEFVYLPVSGYVLQGRHLLPASLGLGVLVLHRVTPARIALIALLVLMNGLLIQATVDRYYSGQWRIATYAMPFNR